MQIKNISYIFWDNDGVLVDTEECYFRANLRAFADISLEFSNATYMEYMARGESIWNLARINNFPEELVQKQRTKRNEYYLKLLETEDITIPHVEEVISRLAKHYKMGIVTTSKRVDFDIIHQHREITKYMDFCLTVKDYPRPKPHPDPYIKAMSLFHAKPEQCLVIEDSQRGLESAYNAGIPCVIVSNKFVESHDFSKATYKIEALTELLDLLELKHAKSIKL